MGRTPPLGERLCAATLSPLHGASRLTVLDISHRHSISMDDDELIELVDAAPALVILSLNPAPVCIGDKPTLSLGVLGKLAHTRPSMEMVRLYVDAMLDDDCVLEGPTRQFIPSMRSLWLNAPPIDETESLQHRVAVYLGGLLPKNTNIDVGVLKGSMGTRVYFWDHVPPVSRRFMRGWRRVAEIIELGRSPVL